MKLLFVTEFFPKDSDLKFTGGVESYNFSLINQLSKTNQVTVICRDQKGIGDDWPFRVIRVGPASGRIDTGILTVPKRLLFMLSTFLIGIKEDFDLVQGNNFVTYLPAFCIGFVKKKPTVAWYPDVFRGSWFKLTGLVSGVVGELSETISLRLPWNRLVALSNSTKDKLIKNGVSEDKIDTIYAGVDIDYFKKIKVRKAEVFTISCVSRLVSYKRVDCLIKALSIIKDKNIKFQAEIIGDGPEGDNLKRLVDNRGLKNEVIFKSNISRVALARTLKSSHLFCLPSTQEGFGLVILEAAACGVPFLVSDLPVLKEVTKEQGGLFFTSGNEKDLAEKLEELINNKELLSRLSKEAEELAKLYSWEDVAEQFEKVYKKLVEKQLHILMLVDAWFPHVGGGQIHAWELSKRLADLGCQVTIFTRNLGQWQERYPGVLVIRTGHFKKFANIFGRFEYLVSALIYSLGNDFDILHAHAFSPGLIVPIIKFFKSRPIVFTVHGKGVKVAGLGIGARWLEDLVVYNIPYDLEITVAKNTLTKKVAARKLKIIPNGVDIDRFRSAQRQRTQVKNILYVGRLSHEKGVDLLISAFNQLKDARLKLIIVGDGLETDSLKKQADDKRIEFIGSKEGQDLIDQYKQADLLVLPSRTEGQPLVLFEAWATKLPVLLTLVGDNARYVKDGVNGFLCLSNVESIGEALHTIMRRDDLSEIVDKGYRDVQNYTWEKIANLTMDNYRKLTDG